MTASSINTHDSSGVKTRGECFRKYLVYFWNVEFKETLCHHENDPVVPD